MRPAHDMRALGRTARLIAALALAALAWMALHRDALLMEMLP